MLLAKDSNKNYNYYEDLDKNQQDEYNIVLTILVTLQTGTYSTAPAEALATTGVICTDLLLGIITP